MVLVRKVRWITATTAVGLALLSCAPRPRVVYAPPPPVVYVPSSQGVRAPLPPPARYVHAPSPAPYSPPTAARYRKFTYVGSEAPPQASSEMSRSSPRWTAVKKKTRTSTAKSDPLARFKAAQAKAAKVGVENLTKEDIEGLSSAQITELRGY